MPVAETQSFVGIANENEFYGHHYLAEVFKGDIRARIEAWQAAESDESTGFRAPHRRLGGLGAKWFAGLANHSHLRDDAEKLRNHEALHASLLDALGYRLALHIIELQPGMP